MFFNLCTLCNKVQYIATPVLYRRISALCTFSNKYFYNSRMHGIL